mmetsp:Transcript_100808/g.225988  ORF Transcript_100808/g.225988 Transcript_100808/m.225988 type:complete len:328 (+) Transcript_100808:247-1230(+)
MDHVELLRGAGHAAVSSQVAVGSRQVLARQPRGLQRDRGVVVVDQMELLVPADQDAGRDDPPILLRGQVLSEVPIQGDGPVIVVVDVELLPRVHLLAVEVGGSIVLRDHELPLRAPEGDDVRLRKLATGQHQAVRRGATLSGEARARGLRGALPLLLHGERVHESTLVRAVGSARTVVAEEAHGRVGRSELNEGVLVQLPHQALHGLRGRALGHRHADVLVGLGVPDAHLGAQLEDLLAQQLTLGPLAGGVREADDEAAAWRPRQARLLDHALRGDPGCCRDEQHQNRTEASKRPSHGCGDRTLSPSLSLRVGTSVDAGVPAPGCHD